MTYKPIWTEIYYSPFIQTVATNSITTHSNDNNNNKCRCCIYQYTPLEQAQAVLQTLQMLLGIVVVIPRAIVKAITGHTLSEIHYSLSQIDIQELSRQLPFFASTMASLIISLVKVVANAIVYMSVVTKNASSYQCNYLTPTTI